MQIIPPIDDKARCVRRDVQHGLDAHDLERQLGRGRAVAQQQIHHVVLARRVVARLASGILRLDQQLELSASAVVGVAPVHHGRWLEGLHL